MARLQRAGATYVSIGNSSARADIAAEGERLLGEANALHSDLVAAMRRSALEPVVPGGPRQYPHVFGWGMEQHGPRNATGYHPPTVDVFVQYRTFPEVFYSAAMPLDVMADIADDYSARGALRLNVWYATATTLQCSCSALNDAVSWRTGRSRLWTASGTRATRRCGRTPSTAGAMACSSWTESRTS